MTRRTPLYDEHVKLGAKIVDFAGWEMPVYYSSIIDEHNATRTKCGIFDVSHMGEITVKGKNSSTFLKILIPTDFAKLEEKKSMYSVFCNENGGVIDDLFIYMVTRDEYIVVVNAGTIEKDFNWMQKNLIDDVEIENISDKTAKIDLQGPLSKKILSEIIKDSRLEEMKRFRFDNFIYKNINIIISNSGYTGESGFEIYIDNSLAASMWNDLLTSGKKYGILPVGLGARDSLRLESSYSLYGHELSDTITPVEGGIKWIVSSKEEYIAKKILADQKENGASRESIAFKMTGKGIPREGYKIFHNNIEIGYATSGGFGPTLKNGIGLALVKSGSAKTGDAITVLIREKHIEAVVAEKPFYKYNG